MRVTSKGQVAIPRDVRRRLGVEPGSEVDFVVDVPPDAAVALVRHMRGCRLTMTTDEIMALTRGES